MMFFIMLPCYLIVLGAFWYTLNSAAKPNGYLLLGVTFPKEQMKRQELKDMVGSFQKKKKMLLASMAVLLVPAYLLRDYPMSGCIYCFIWIGIMLAAYQTLLNRTFDEAFAFKCKNGWTVGEKQTISIDTEVTRLKAQFVYPKWHWIVNLVLTAVACYLWRPEEEGFYVAYALAGCIIITNVALFIIYMLFSRVRTRVYSSRQDVNVALNHTYCHNMTKSMVYAAYGNSFCWLVGGLFDHPYRNVPVILAVCTMTCIITVAVIFYFYEKVMRERRKFDTMEEDTFAADEDIYWRGGLYNNPNDPKLWAEKRIGIGLQMNGGHPSAKILNVVTALIIIGCMALLVKDWKLDFPSLSVQMTVQTIEIQATGYDQKILLSDIESVEVIEELPGMFKNNGLANRGYDFGAFHVSGYGQCKVYVKNNQPPFVVLHLKEDKIVIVNSEKQEETQKLIRELEGSF